MPIPAAPPVPTAIPGAAAAVERHGEAGRRWLRALWRGDPLADAVVAEGAAPLVRDALAEGIDAVPGAPEPLRALFAALDRPPAWADDDRCDRAAGHLARHGGEYGLVLGAASLVAGAQNTVAGKPLVFTGRYAGDAAVRTIEVASWLTAVTTPGGLRRRAPGFERTVRVRMIHAHVRAHLAAHPGWDADAWGMPICQPYMVFTLAEFCSVALAAMARLGVRYTDAEREDIVHLWRCVGSLVGVDEDLLPRTPEDYARIEDLYALTSPGADDGDRAFVAALGAFQAAELARVLPARWAPGVVAGLQRAFVGDAIADDLGIARTRWRHLPALLAPANRAACAAFDRVVPDGRAWRTARGFRVREQELARLRAAYGVAHQLVDDAPGPAQGGRRPHARHG